MSGPGYFRRGFDRVRNCECCAGNVGTPVECCCWLTRAIFACDHSSGDIHPEEAGEANERFDLLHQTLEADASRAEVRRTGEHSDQSARPVVAAAAGVGSPEDGDIRSGPDRDQQASETVEAVRRLRIAEFREVHLREWPTQE